MSEQSGPTAGAGPAVASVPERPPVHPTERLLRLGGAVVLLAVAVYAPFYFDPAMNDVLSHVLYLAIASQGLNLLIGYNGQVSIGHGAFFGLGAFTSAILVREYGWGFEETIPVAGLAAAALGVLIGIPALRVRGLYLALVTLGLAVLFPQLMAKVIEEAEIGVGGVALVQPKASAFTSLIDSLDNDQYAYFLCLGIALLLFGVAWSLVHSRVGRAMIAVRDQEIAASTVGIHLARVKVGTFAVSAAYAGVAGALSVMITRVADATNPVTYFQLSIEFLVVMAIGGAATITGPLVGAVIVVFLRRETEGLIEGKEMLAPAIFGAGLILIVFVLPEGVVGGVRRLTAALIRKTSGPRGPAGGAEPVPEQAPAH